MTNILDTVAFNIRNIRLKKGFTQEQLAELSGLHRTYIGALERGKRNISLVNLKKICAALEISPPKIFLKLRKRDKNNKVSRKWYKRKNGAGENNHCVSSANHSDEMFHIALKNTSIIIAHCDLELKYTWIYNSHPDFLYDSCIGKKDDDLGINEGILQLINLKKKVIETGIGARETISFPLSNGMIAYDVIAEPLKDNDNQIIGVTTVSTPQRPKSKE
ncbi:helix-turn-helix domain-containing protein [Heliorestis convoluta]|uniref:Two-component hybrid sensor and regulator n=1 Tax=Heliorestis convoluta TaxID=356322 RepID=A0A5Q2MZK0_9FIRM|nr:helix-turn-helix transcriptional regulator [Heliorestis convoluta]QGG46873.1 Two-component hybrid sensor and regulator [Heliorestis convoluta]